MRTHFSRWSRQIHNRHWPGSDESLCSHAWRGQFTDWRWLVFRETADIAALIFAWERDHCLRANQHHWRATWSSQSA